jgi:hypothetical protein
MPEKNEEISKKSLDKREVGFMLNFLIGFMVIAVTTMNNPTKTAIAK